MTKTIELDLTEYIAVGESEEVAIVYAMCAYMLAMHPEDEHWSSFVDDALMECRVLPGLDIKQLN